MEIIDIKDILKGNIQKKLDKRLITATVDDVLAHISQMKYCFLRENMA